jgi:pimeloyl-ACP methyl ester carboxylesterase
MDYVEMAADVLQLIERLRLDRPTVLGHSMGGKTAMALALRHPTRVGRPDRRRHRAGVVCRHPDAVRRGDARGRRRRGREPRRSAAAAAAERSDDGVVPFLMQNLVTRNDHFDWRLNLLGISLAMPALCAFPSTLLGMRFDGPVTVLCGEHSDYVARHDAALFAPMFSEVGLEVIAEAGHWVHADQPAEFLTRVREALQSGMPAPSFAPGH